MAPFESDGTVVNQTTKQYHVFYPQPGWAKQAEYISNLRCVTEDPLTATEMKILAAIDKNCRLIKGQVFLWEDAKDWEDLWDIDGTITK